MEGGEKVKSGEMRKRTLELSFRRPFLLILSFRFSSFFLLHLSLSSFDHWSERMSSAQEIQLRSYQKSLKEGIKSLADNYLGILQLVKTLDGESNVQLAAARSQETCYEMHVRAAHMTRAAESILKLIWDIKQYLIINDFPLINETISNKSKNDYGKVEEMDAKLTTLRDDISHDLFELEDEFYNSLIK